jgi:hypothetical protein
MSGPVRMGKGELFAARAEVERLKQEVERSEKRRHGSIDAYDGLLVDARQQRDAARAEALALKELVRECGTDLKDAGHQSPRCEYFQRCTCGLEDLLHRIEAALDISKAQS